MNSDALGRIMAPQTPLRRAGRRTCHPAAVEDGGKAQSKLARVSWSVTALAFLLGAVGLLMRGDTAYGIVTLLVALSAAVNLF